MEGNCLVSADDTFQKVSDISVKTCTKKSSVVPESACMFFVCLFSWYRGREWISHRAYILGLLFLLLEVVYFLGR